MMKVTSNAFVKQFRASLKLFNNCGERHETTVSTVSSKSKLRSEELQKLAQMQSNYPISTFPLLKGSHLSERLTSQLNNNSENNVKSVYYPSVTTILNKTMSAQSLAALERWKKMKIELMGDQAFKAYQQRLLSRGKLLHLNIRQALQGKQLSDLTITEDIEKLWKSLQHVLPTINDVKLCETFIFHPYLCYKGIVDCVGVIDGNVVIIEWKTSEKLKPTLNHIYDNPLQAVAYLGALNFDSNHDLYANEALLIYAYEDGTNAQIHHLNEKLCHQYWQQWLDRLNLYWNSISKA